MAPKQAEAIQSKLLARSHFNSEQAILSMDPTNTILSHEEKS